MAHISGRASPGGRELAPQAMSGIVGELQRREKELKRNHPMSVRSELRHAATQVQYYGIQSPREFRQPYKAPACP